ncbi:hypothetical protein BKA61DRAFT_579809 [Leptodontidium sp. MPI-SDFR-AT-0119]|nr:hypothetical protein BKA61DRAFT_579809 [Leptodontidium sp. MPI-SDFR-AT-0119]
MSTLQQAAIKLNITQNDPNFALDAIETQALIFKKKLFSKVLDPIKENPQNIDNYRTVTVKCLYPSCRKTWLNQRVYHSTSNYITHYKTSHKAFNIGRILNQLDDIDSSDFTESSQASNNTTITDVFARQRASKRPISPDNEKFNLIKFKKLLLNFIILNNISFRAVSSKSFKELLLYLSNQIPPLYYQTLKNDLNSIYLEKKSLIKEELQDNIKSNSGFSLTLDAWTVINQDSYLGITIHFINKNFVVILGWYH